MRKTDLYLLEYIQTEMLQSQNMPQMRQNTVFNDASGRKEAVHEETLSRTTCLVTYTLHKEWRGSRGRIYSPYDDTLAMAFLAYSNLPTILLTDLKI